MCCNAFINSNLSCHAGDIHYNSFNEGDKKEVEKSLELTLKLTDISQTETEEIVKEFIQWTKHDSSYRTNFKLQRLLNTVRK